MDVVDVDEDGVGMMISDDVPGAWESEVTLGEEAASSTGRNARERAPGATAG
jgi:hypothetical protein